MPVVLNTLEQDSRAASTKLQLEIERKPLSYLGIQALNLICL
jgi:hypothetical protein